MRLVASPHRSLSLQEGKLIETATGLEKVADIVSHNPTISNDDIHGFSRKTVSNPLDKDFTVIIFPACIDVVEMTVVHMAAVARL